jgi:pimeloyl-ACP methyl ester carboxylesterase
MIPGWSQSAMEFKHQLGGLSDKYHVYAIDMRGHGDCEKPDHGYHIQHLSETSTNSSSRKTLPASPWQATPWAAR